MPDRIIRDELLTSERYWTVCDEAKLLYIHILLCADDTARYTARNFSLRQKCFAGRSMEPERMERLLNELADNDMIRLYEVSGERFLFVPRFRQRLRFQHSKFPEPPKEINDLEIKKTDLRQTQDSLKTAEVKRSEEKRSNTLPPQDAPATPKVKASRLPSDWELTDELREYCRTTRPDLDPDLTAREFKNYWLAKSGKDATKLRWDLTWHNWVMRSHAKPAFAKPSSARSGGYAEVL